MRDWDHNGRIDARDRYIFHEIILKDDEPDYNNSFDGGSQWRRSEVKETAPKEKEKMSGYEIFFWMVFGVMALIGLVVG